MLDIHYLEQYTELVKQALAHRGVPEMAAVVDQLLACNTARKSAQYHSDELAAKLKKLHKQIGNLLRQGLVDDANQAKQEVANKKAIYKTALLELKEREETMERLLPSLPNIPHESVPVGKTADDNQVVHQWGEVREGAADLKPHWELLEQFGLASFADGSKIAGAGFPVYKGQGARLQRSLTQFFLQEAIAHGYEEVIPPLLVKEEVAFGTGQLPDKEGQMYRLLGDALFLIPTAEVPVTNLYREMVLSADKLPIRHVAGTVCFRREAGSWGADVRGLNRLHQFDKVELVEIVHPAHSIQALEQMVTYVQGLLEKLGLPYRTLRLCTGELGFAPAITYDLEVWSPGQQRWLEVSSVSLFRDFQARRMQLRFQEDGQLHFCYTINGSGLALPRVMAALLEHYQQEGQILVPEVLQPFMGQETIGG